MKIMPKLSGPLVVTLLYDGLCTFEFGIVAEIFGLARPEMGDSWYRFQSVAIEDGPLRAHGGLLLMPQPGIALLAEADIIVVPGWKSVEHPVPEALCDALVQAHQRGARLVSICSGAFVLAATGLLDHGSATTHWRYAAALKARHPLITVDDASLYRSHGRIFTSAGSAAGIDLLIEIVRQDFGPKAANSVARRLVMPAHRTGGQAQFLERPVPLTRQTEIAPLLDDLRLFLAEDWTLQRMADKSHMSLRTFVRRFTDATGVSPGEWLLRARLEEAKRLLSEGEQDMDRVASLSGLSTPDTLRHHFRKRLGISPREYRLRFAAEPAA